MSGRGRALDRAALVRLLARPNVRAVLDALADRGEETRLVGGCVRDALLGSNPDDIDLATTLLPRQVMARASIAAIKPVPSGIAHGTVTLVTSDGPIEVTTLREDVETDGRHAVVRFGRDFPSDAARRDFTVNALSLDARGRLHDTTGGEADLEQGRVRFIGDPATRIREDALRILRFFRFHARFGRGAPDAEGLAACIEARDAIDTLSRERVRTEFLKLLATEGADATIATLSDTGLLGRITGGVSERGRLARAIAGGLPASLRLAALSVASSMDAERLRDRLRLSNAEAELLAAYAAVLIALRNGATLDAGRARALAAVYGLTAIETAITVLDGEPRPRITAEVRTECRAMKYTGAPRFPLTGAVLVARGIPPGPRIGQGLSAARDLWLRLGCPMDDTAIATLTERAVAQARSSDAERT